MGGLEIAYGLVVVVVFVMIFHEIIIPFWKWLTGSKPGERDADCTDAEDAIQDAIKCTKDKTGCHKCGCHDETQY